MHSGVGNGRREEFRSDLVSRILSVVDADSQLDLG